MDLMHLIRRRTVVVSRIDPRGRFLAKHDGIEKGAKQ